MTTKAALTAVSGHFSSICSNPTLVSSSGGKASRDAIEKSACRNGRPAPKRITSVCMRTAHGRSMTVVAIFAHTPSPVSFSVLKANLIFPMNTL